MSRVSADNYIKITDDARAKAKNFFDKAAPLVSAGQYDYAFTMYLSGLKLDPESVDAHEALRNASLRRKAAGGKKIGMFEAMKYSTKGKDEIENMNNAERLLAFDPGDTGHMQSLLETAYRAGCYDTALWIGPILGRANNELPKPDFAKFRVLRDHYAKLGRWTQAVEVCTRMVQMKPDDGDLKNELKNLSAEEAMNKGKYSQSFRESVRDMGKQQELLASERDASVGDAFQQKMVKDAEAELATNPNDPALITKLVDALIRVGTPESDEKAGEVLHSAFERTGAFRFRQRMIEMRGKQLSNQDRALRQALAAADEAKKKAPTDADAIARAGEALQQYKEFRKARVEEELGLYEEIAEQYPTEVKYKYEVANRMVALGRYTDAIPLFQQAVNDPKLRHLATLSLGKTFLEAEFPDEAADTLKGLIESYPAITAGDDMAKQVMYWHGRALESKGDIAEALKSYSQVVKWDFNYGDTQKRMKELRAKASAS